MIFKREGNLWVEYTRPLREFGETLVFIGVVSVRYRKCVTAATVECFIEVHYLSSDLAVVCFTLCNFARGKKFADLPVHSNLKGIFYRQCSIVNEECVVESFRYCYLSEHFYKFSHFLSVNV